MEDDMEVSGEEEEEDIKVVKNYKRQVRGPHAAVQQHYRRSTAGVQHTYYEWALVKTPAKQQRACLPAALACVAACMPSSVLALSFC
jgi:hypothetical protein